jgi:hypothetical protein
MENKFSEQILWGTIIFYAQLCGCVLDTLLRESPSYVTFFNPILHMWFWNDYFTCGFEVRLLPCFPTIHYIKQG